MDIFVTCDKNMGYVFTGVKKLLWETFLPRLFIVKSKYLPPIVESLSTILDKKSGLGLQNMVTSANERILSLKRASTELIRDGMGESEFSIADNVQAV